MKTQMKTLALMMASAGLLIACGGGGTTVSRTTGTISLTGVVATGAAAPAGTTVTANCLGTSDAPVSSTGLTTASGSYSVAVPAAALPCLLSATVNGQVLTSLAQGTTTAGTTTNAIANITPVTTLVVANVAGTDPATFFASFNASKAAVITSSAVTAAVTKVTTQLSDVGVILPSGTDVLAGPLVAANGSTAGNAYDVALDTLQANLTSNGSTLAELTTTAVATSPAASVGGGAVVGADVAMLPANLQSLPKAATCDALRSTTYRVIGFAPSATTGATDPVTTTQTFSFDASTLKTAPTDPAWVPVANEPCHFNDGQGGELVVSQAGVVVARTAGNRLKIAFPEQSATLADLAGTWNTLSWDLASGGTYSAAAVTLTVGANGALTSVQCDSETLATSAQACTTFTANLPTFAVSSSGSGFDFSSSTASSSPFKDRAFVYRAGNGDAMAVLISADGSFGFLTAQRTLSLPSVNRVRQIWNTAVASSGSLADTAYSYSINKIKSVSNVTGSTDFVRTNQVNIGLPNENTRDEALNINTARAGYVYRPAQQVLDTTNVSRNVSEFYSMSLRGMGLSVLSLPGTTPPTSGQFQVSVQRP